jgi:hypothetical protein
MRNRKETAVRAAAMFAPVPDDVLPVIPLASWKEREIPFGRAGVAANQGQ